MTMASSATASVTLPADDQILIVREFDAPRELVFRAWTEPDLVRQWWHAGRGEMTVCEIDLRPGGSWRYVMVTPDGTDVAFHGEYREVVPGERIVQTEIYDPFPDAAAVDTLEFEDLDGRTRVTMLVQHQLKEHRDAHVESGMEDGLQDALDLLEGVAQSLV
jgi:uncharacterized protein YndB with AHSA1/START domain